jgi:hypothetical protein
MKYRAMVCSILFAGLGSTAALAQDTLGELLDSGGRKLSKEEVTATIGGSSFGGPTKGGGQIVASYKADGSLAGVVRNPQGGGSGNLSGTWTVDDTGKLCASFSVGGRRTTDCAFVFKGTIDYYVCESDSDKAAPVLKRTLKR